MDNSKTVAPSKPTGFSNGIYAIGVVVSNRAKAFQRKDGSGISVVVEHEIALQPGVAIWQRYFDPAKDPGLKLEGAVVVDFPKLKEFTAVTIKAAKVRSDEHTGQVTIRGGELVA
ncbi:MAG: hypothetical protein QM691_08480 [Opitutaceae bacterium]